MELKSLKKDLRDAADLKKAKDKERYFKTGKGEYAEGDVFIGISTPDQRKIVSNYKFLNLSQIRDLLSDKIHEFRFCALLLLIEKYQEDEKKIVDFYLNNLDRVNNRDLVDLSAPKITGDCFLNREKDRLKELIFSNNLWKRRVAIVSTLGFIRKGHLDTTFDYSKLLLEDSHDLIHKAVGWMLRETGKRDKERLKEFLKENYSYMSRVTLRYSIERFDQEERDKFLRLL